MSKKFLFIFRINPYNTSRAQEALDVVLMASTFDHDVSLIFLGDGVYLLKKEQNPSEILLKNFSLTYKAMSLYGIQNIYVENEALLQRGLSLEDFIIPVTTVDSDQVSQIIHQHDVIMSY